MESGRIAPLRHGKEIVAARRSVSKAAVFKLLWILMTTFYIEQFGCAGDCHRLLCAARPRRVGVVARCFVGCRQFTQAGNSLVNGFDSESAGKRIDERVCAGQRAWRGAVFAATWPGEDFDWQYF